MLYTDGLIEARQGADTFGAERAVRRRWRAERRSAAEARVERLIDAARRHEDQSLRDDVVVVAIERPVPIPWAAPDAPPPGEARAGALPPAGQREGAAARLTPRAARWRVGA